ncbi:MAG: SpvB/TcaC N-terminal domain-containing protein, partial [Myxococcota bacterium]
MNTATPKRESQHYVTLMGIRQALWTRVLTALLGGLMGGSFGGCSDIGGGLHQPAQRNTRHHDHAPALQRTSQPLGSTHTPDATDTSDAQAAFKSPVSNTGAFTQTIPIDIPHGIGGLQPELSLTYSSQGGPSMVGVGWNLSMGMVWVKAPVLLTGLLKAA